VTIVPVLDRKRIEFLSSGNPKSSRKLLMMLLFLGLKYQLRISFFWLIRSKFKTKSSQEFLEE
jgi:hypothetical protein